MTEDKSKNNEQNEPWDIIQVLISMPLLTVLLAVKTAAVIQSIFINFSTALTRKAHQYIDYLLHTTLSKETKEQQDEEQKNSRGILKRLWPSSQEENNHKQQYKNKILKNVHNYASQNTWESAEDIATNVTNVITSAVERAVLGHEVPAISRNDTQNPWHSPLTQFVPETVTSMFENSPQHSGHTADPLN